MFGLLGTAAVWTGLVAACWLVVETVGAVGSPARAERPRTPLRLLVGAAAAAFLALEAAILTNDFTVAYVADHHSRFTPFPFDVATAWAALEGSIVLWLLVLAAFTWVVFRDARRNTDPLGWGALAVMAAVAVFFFGLVATVANPFETCVEAAARSCAASSPVPLLGATGPADGAGPNPLLQNHILMAVHPPMLYLGYVGLTVPYAYAMAALALGMPGSAWLQRSKRSTLIAWSFLTLGIVLGGWWAYEVLNWGGYWAWDPVENASFMPWLVATAFIHSALTQERRGMLQSWNFVLVIAAFSLTILGTFLTRSGTVASVHSFTQSAIGPVLLGFLVAVLVASFTLFAVRAPQVAQPSRLDALSSREGAFLFNNLLLSVYALVVLVGTIYPIVLEALSGDRVQVGEPFFNRIAVPLSFGLVLAMGIGPVMPWRYADPRLVGRRIHGPLQLGLLVGLVVVVAVTRVGWVVLAAVLSSFVVAVIGRHLLVLAARRSQAREVGLGTAIGEVLRSDPGYWGGQLSHVGVALVVVGIAFASNLATHSEARLAPGESVAFAGYQVTYQAPFTRPEPNKTVEGATVEVSREGRPVAVLRPALNLFEGSAFAIQTPAVYSTFSGDLYLTVLRLDPDGVTLRMDTSPLQWMVWLGGLITAAGGFVSVRSRVAARRRERVAV